MKNLKKSVLSTTIAALAVFGFNLIPIAGVYADGNICNQDGVPAEVKAANGCGGDTNDLSDTIVNILTGIVGSLGLVAAIFIVVGGINYMTSQGDPGKTKKAKDTILYAAIGLVICVLAFAIVNFVIKNIIKS